MTGFLKENDVHTVCSLYSRYVPGKLTGCMPYLQGPLDRTGAKGVSFLNLPGRYSSRDTHSKSTSEMSTPEV